MSKFTEMGGLKFGIDVEFCIFHCFLRVKEGEKLDDFEWSFTEILKLVRWTSENT